MALFSTFNSFASAGIPGNPNFKTFGYTGTGLSQPLTAGIQPDLVLTYRKDGASPSWPLYDSVRGSQKYLNISENAAPGGSITDTQSLTTFNSNGFTIGTSGVSNANTKAYQAFTCAKAANVLDIQTYTGTGGNLTVPHSLSGLPGMMLTGFYSGASASQMILWHSGFATPASQYIVINNDTCGVFSSSTIFNNTAPTSTNFYLGGSSQLNSISGGTNNYINYLFGTTAGNSAFGTYTGNGSVSGPSVNLNFQPSLVMICQQSGAGFNLRWIYGNSASGKLNIDGAAEDTTNYINLTGTGFTVVTTNSDFNTNSQTYLYSAWR